MGRKEREFQAGGKHRTSLAHSQVFLQHVGTGIRMLTKSHEAPGLEDWLVAPTVDYSTMPRSLAFILSRTGNH